MPEKVSVRLGSTGADTVVFWIDGDAEGFNAPSDADYARAGFELAHLARNTLHLRMTEPRAPERKYIAAPGVGERLPKGLSAYYRGKAELKH